MPQATEDLLNYITRDLQKEYKARRPSAKSPEVARMLRQVESFVQQGADVNAVNKYGKTPLMCASIISFPELLVLLAKHGADVNAGNADDRTPLMSAAGYGNVIILRTLLQQLHADVNAVNKYGRCALAAAASFGQASACHALIDLGANVEIYGNDGYTPYMLAEFYGHSEAATALAARGAKAHALPVDSEGRVSPPQRLLAPGASAEAQQPQQPAPMLSIPEEADPPRPKKHAKQGWAHRQAHLLREVQDDTPLAPSTSKDMGNVRMAQGPGAGRGFAKLNRSRSVLVDHIPLTEAPEPVQAPADKAIAPPAGFKYTRPKPAPLMRGGRSQTLPNIIVPPGFEQSFSKKPIGHDRSQTQIQRTPSSSLFASEPASESQDDHPVAGLFLTRLRQSIDEARPSSLSAGGACVAQEREANFFTSAHAPLTVGAV